MSSFLVGQRVRVRPAVTTALLREQGILGREHELKSADHLLVREVQAHAILVADPEPRWDVWWIPVEWLESAS
jgi:hypothetical protein